MLLSLFLGVSSQAANSSPLSLQSQRPEPVWSLTFKGDWTSNVATAFGRYTTNQGLSYFSCESARNSTSLSVCKLYLYNGQWNDDALNRIEFREIAFDAVSGQLTLSGIGNLKSTWTSQSFPVQGTLRYSGNSLVRLSGSVVCDENTRFFLTLSELKTESLAAPIETYSGVVLIVAALELVAYIYLWKDCKSSQRLSVQLSYTSLLMQLSSDIWLLLWHLLLILSPASESALAMVCGGTAVCLVMVLMVLREVWREQNRGNSFCDFVAGYLANASAIVVIAMFVMIYYYQVIVVFLSFFYLPQIYSNAQNREPNKIGYLTYGPLGASRLVLIVTSN